MVKSYKYDQSQYVEWFDRAVEDYLTANNDIEIGLKVIDVLIGYASKITGYQFNLTIN